MSIFNYYNYLLFSLFLPRASKAAAAHCVGVVAVGGKVFAEDALGNALAFGQGYVAVGSVKQPQHDMPFVVLVVVVVGVDNTHVVHQRQSFFNGDAAADMHAKELVVLHIGFYAGRHHFQFVRFQFCVPASGSQHLRKLQFFQNREFSYYTSL